MSKPTPPLPLEARRAIWNRLWDRLLQPLPSEVVPADEQHPSPEDEQAARRDKEALR
jgi:hypothetical protein